MPVMVLRYEVLNVHQLVVKVLKSLLSSRKARIVLHLVVLDQRLADVFLIKKINYLVFIKQIKKNKTYMPLLRLLVFGKDELLQLLKLP